MLYSWVENYESVKIEEYFKVLRLWLSIGIIKSLKTFNETKI
jgi:hypothetical protein